MSHAPKLTLSSPELEIKAYPVDILESDYAESEPSDVLFSYLQPAGGLPGDGAFARSCDKLAYESIASDPSTLDDVNKFLKNFVNVIHTASGFSDEIRPEDDPNRKIKDGNCVVTGLRQDSTFGCKTTSSTQLMLAVKILMNVFLTFFSKLKSNNPGLMDFTQVNAYKFSRTLQHLASYYGFHSRGNIYSGSFEKFYAALNELFDGKVVVRCGNTSSYGCGRMIFYTDCEGGGKKIVVTHTTGDRNSGLPNNFSSLTESNRTSMCGGARRSSRKARRSSRKSRRLSRRR
jgi:hypothetical protein